MYNKSPNAMIVTAQPEASEAGARVLMRGGNAVDAAMAAALVQGVVDPPLVDRTIDDTLCRSTIQRAHILASTSMAKHRYRQHQTCGWTC